MKFKQKFNITPEFENLFSFKSKEEEFQHEAKMITQRFLNELEKLNSEKPMKRKDLAKLIGTSASYITQLYRGDKLVNFITLAKLQEIYDVTFEIKAKPNSVNYSKESAPSFDPSLMNNVSGDNYGYWIFKSFTPNYNSIPTAPTKKRSHLKVA